MHKFVRKGTPIFRRKRAQFVERERIAERRTWLKSNTNNLKVECISSKNAKQSSLLVKNDINNGEVLLSNSVECLLHECQTSDAHIVSLLESPHRSDNSQNVVNSTPKSNFRTKECVWSLSPIYSVQAQHEHEQQHHVRNIFSGDKPVKNDLFHDDVGDNEEKKEHHLHNGTFGVANSAIVREGIEEKVQSLKTREEQMKIGLEVHSMSNQLRRSHRNRRKPFMYWRGERYKYKKGPACFEVIGVTTPRPLDICGAGRKKRNLENCNDGNSDEML